MNLVILFYKVNFFLCIINLDKYIKKIDKRTEK